MVGTITLAGTQRLHTVTAKPLGGGKVWIIQAGSGENFAAIYIAAVPTGTTGTVSVVTNNSIIRMGVVVWSAEGLASSSATATGTSAAANPTASLNVSAGGCALAVSFSQTSTSATWAGLTEVADVVINTTNTYTGAGGNFAAAQTPLAMTCTWAVSTNRASAFATFR